MDGDHGGPAVVTGGAELLQVIPLSAAEFHSSLRGWVGVGDAARYGADGVQRHAALDCGLGLFASRFGTPS